MTTTQVDNSLCLVTPTWAADAEHFHLMRHSLDHSALAELTHHVVVQTEDINQFEQYREHPAVNLLSSEEVLPADVEARRFFARMMRQRLGRDATRILTSLNRYLNRPQWVRYTGWHTQQLIKLFVAAGNDSANVVVLDSDVVVTPSASANDFIHPDRIVAFADSSETDQVNTKVKNWNKQACRLWNMTPADQRMDVYFDTPFVLNRIAVRHMLHRLERDYQDDWWRVLLAQPPRRWSEFATYLKYLRHVEHDLDIDWRDTSICRYIFDASDPLAVEQIFASYYQDPDCHYITIHSQSSGRQLWSAESYLDRISQYIG